MTYRLIVMARTVKRDTATRPYRVRGNSSHSSWPWRQARCQNVDAARGRLKQQNMRSDTLRLMMNTAVALRTCEQTNRFSFIGTVCTGIRVEKQ
jgi:hypothetical protein